MMDLFSHIGWVQMHLSFHRMKLICTKYYITVKYIVLELSCSTGIDRFEHC